MTTKCKQNVSDFHVAELCRRSADYRGGQRAAHRVREVAKKRKQTKKWNKNGQNIGDHRNTKHIFWPQKRLTSVTFEQTGGLCSV